MKYTKWQRRVKEEESYETNTQLKMTSLKQVCFMCMLIFKLSIYNNYCELYKMAKKDGKRIYSSNKYSTQDDIIGAGMFHGYVYI